MFSFPPHWHYDVLKALVHLAERKVPYDERMQPALDLVLNKRTPEGLWLLENKYPGKEHFRMEKVGQPSVWNTLRALKVLRNYEL
jgi:hypothetical protein